MSYDYTELDELLKNSFDAELLCELLLKTMHTNIDYSIVVLGENTSQIMARLTKIRKLALAIKSSKS